VKRKRGDTKVYSDREKEKNPTPQRTKYKTGHNDRRLTVQMACARLFVDFSQKAKKIE